MYIRKTVNKSHYHAALVMFVGTLLTLAYVVIQAKIEEAMATEFISPLSDALVIEIERPVEVPVEKYIGCDNEQCEIYSYIVEKFGDDAADMIAIIRTCENSTFDQSRQNHNTNGSIDYGVAQINSIHTATCGEDFKTDWKANIDCAYQVYERAGNSFSPWTCSWTIGTKSFWQ